MSVQVITWRSLTKKYMDISENKIVYDATLDNACSNNRFLVKGTSLNQANAETTQSIPESNLHLPKY